MRNGDVITVAAGGPHREPMPGRRIGWRHVELVGLWGLVPLALWWEVLPGVHVLAGLVVATAYGVIVSWRPRAPWRDLGLPGLDGFGASLRAGLPWVAAALVVLPLVVVGLHGTPGLGRWPRATPEGLAGLLVVYAAVSVTAQEWLYSSFFFWRYRGLGRPDGLDLLNVLAFGLAHLVYGSWVSVGLSILGRLVLVRVYRRYQSYWGVWMLHLVFGLTVFLVGLGGYFYRPLASR